MIASLLTRAGLFLATAVIGAVVTSTAGAVLAPRAVGSTAQDVSQARDVPQVISAPAPEPGAETVLAAFDTVATPGEPSAPLEPLDPPVLRLVAAQLPEPVPDANGLARVPPVSQFDGSPLASANCNMAAGAMLARLGWGVVTTGGALRALQDDQEGGTDFGDLAAALQRGFGVTPAWGGVTPEQLRKLIGAGYGVVVHGIYGVLPVPYSKQPSFKGAHAVYVDAYFPGSRASGPAYYVVDTIHVAGGGYRGEWIPADLVERFALTLTGNGRISAAWAYPQGRTPPAIPDIGELPTAGQGSAFAGIDPNDPARTTAAEPGTIPPANLTPPRPIATPLPTPTAGSSGSGSGSGIGGSGVQVGGIRVVPRYDLCVVAPRPATCPSGIVGRYLGGITPPAVPPAPRVAVSFVDGTRPNEILVGFTVDPPATASVSYWRADGTGGVLRSTSVSSVAVRGVPTLVARLPVLAATTYRFQVLAAGVLGGKSAVGSFATGPGVKTLEVSAGSADRPVFRLDTVNAAVYTRLVAGFLAPAIQACDGGAQADRILVGGQTLCLPAATVTPPAACPVVRVRYEMAGPTDAVVVRAVPAAGPTRPDGSPAPDTTIEVVGKPDGDAMTLGCLLPGSRYTIEIDVQGDGLGPLLTREVVAPAR